MWLKRRLLLLTVALFPAAIAAAQGCSDAGFCSIGSIKTDSRPFRHKHLVTINPAYGNGEHGVGVYTLALQYDYMAGSRTTLQARITGNYATGDLGNVAGPGDVWLNVIQSLYSKKELDISLNLGVKLPLNGAKREKDGRALPMGYQPSLGTTDLVTGIALFWKQWQLAAAWQQPLSGRNKNTFFAEDWPGNAHAMQFRSTNRFLRKGDVLLRLNRHLRVGDAWVLNAGLLPVYHLANDSYIDKSGNSISIEGSRGLTLNANIAALFKASQRLDIGFTAGWPLVSRDARPEGLTRTMVLSPELKWKF
ncbi:hypothetical protein [Chitinophaga japonensis]|uniref:Outer membrane beta-barrel porin/alpha-amylase n=1 Tax=Chitinophaga japonensis TaxID=104662 RepID=A0A562SSH0_CHIJA|nr:hypothetical protein [Chitinophaga japonensis]TWI84219.1 hypothetical protein LX66_4582 [Chitinophaga japonensis]